jgi:pyruvate dehydrogenase E1 component beta subunit
VERVDPAVFKSRPARITLPDAPAPTSKPLEAAYYPTAADVADKVAEMMGGSATPLAKAG